MRREDTGGKKPQMVQSFSCCIYPKSFSRIIDRGEKVEKIFTPSPDHWDHDTICALGSIHLMLHFRTVHISCEE